MAAHSGIIIMLNVMMMTLKAGNRRSVQEIEEATPLPVRLKPAGPAVTAILILGCGGGVVLLALIGLIGERTCLQQPAPIGKYIYMWCNGMTAFLSPVEIALGVIFLVTGSIGLATVNSSTEHRKAGLKVGFIVLTVFIVLLYGPLYALLSWVELQASDDVDTLPILHIVAAMCMTIVSLIGASAFCCCLPTKDDEPVQALQWTSTGSGSIAMGRLSPQTVDTSPIIDHDQLKDTY